MKKVFVTYLQEGRYKKAELSEERYSQLNNDSTIQELIVYPSSLLMEQNYNTKVSNNNSNKNILHG